jgi:spore maturation protein SpmB
VDDDTRKVLYMSAFGAIGGVIRLCSDGGITSFKRAVASIMIASFAGGLTAAILYKSIADPIYLGALCSIGGWMGQIIIVVAEKRFRKIIDAAMGR